MEAFLIYLIKSSIILALFYLVYFFLLRKDTFFTVNRHFLLAGIISSLLLPFLEFTTIEFIEQPTFQIVEYNTIPTLHAQNTPEPIDWWLIVFVSYIIITLILFIRFGLQLLSLRRIFIRSYNKQNEEFSLIKTTKDIAPFSFFKYIIFNPSLHNSAELEMILKHEKIHAKQYHTLDLLIINSLVIFQWINPFSWFYKKSLQQNLEFIADHEAIRDLPSKKEYQLTLVKVSSNNYSTITNNFYQSLIKKRIVMLNKKQSNYQNLWKATIILPLLSIFLWSFNTKTEIQYIPSEIQESIHTNVSDPYPEKTVANNSKETIFPVKKEHTTTTGEHSFPSKKEHPKTTKNLQNTVKNIPIIATPKKATIAVKEKPITTSKNTLFKKKKVKFIINKNSTKEDLERVKRVFKNEYEVEISFSNIKRNKADEITAISVDMSSKKSNANFSIENETPIKPFVVSYDSKNEKIRIGQSGNSHKNVWISKHSDSDHDDGHIIEIDVDDDGDNIFTVKGDKKHKRKIIRKKGGKNKIILRGDHNDDGLIILHSDDQKTVFDFDDNSGKDVLFYIDGKKASKKEVKKLKSDEIESIDVSKGKSTKKYGKKAKDGVIRITTKKNNKKGTGFNFKIDKNNMHIGSASNDKLKPLIYIDGKKVNYNEFQKIKHEQIASVNVYKAEKAIAKYGDKAENGVVEIMLKK
ncbi:M56 family metallopeptidase [Aquimarina sp. 2201CG14-23]|uniref:M56 family metallopeptidase n=1 Tax=Aquimarina mycalae TaxID=3040073 RepID=UPI00247812DF|nr:M56 family metallopeptidase [Aquimarina sp. 2201CG14-23]MDH7444639.1 M56 family metallopeptidase [Aquimarina sp. 2201CG14-23]